MIDNSLHSLGFSPCPNDTFIFHALVHGLAGEGCRLFAAPVLADVETLNEWAIAGRLDVSKVSFHALGHIRNDYVLLTAGSALGRGCGPLLVAREKRKVSELRRMRVAIPGRYTTAAMLLSLFAPDCLHLEVMRFDRIMAAIAAGEVDAGVIIHESRFTYGQYGLTVLQDLGQWWEEISGHPIPLGGIVAKRSLGPEAIGRINDCIRASVRQAFARPEATMPYVKGHARELAEEVLKNHIRLYVTGYTEELGAEGMAAVREFLRRGQEAGILPDPDPRLKLTSDGIGSETEKNPE